jgi:hypothetical protein
MTEDSDAVGSMRSSAAQRTAFALDSLKFNMRDKSEPVFIARCSFFSHSSGCFHLSSSTTSHNGASNWRSALEALVLRVSAPCAFALS